MNGSIFYACVRQGTGRPTAANRGAVSLDVVTYAAKLLYAVDVAVDCKKTYTAKGLSYSYVTANGTCCLCVTDDVFPRRLCFAFLEHVRTEHALSREITKAFLRDEMEFFSTNPEADKIRHIQAQVDDVKAVMLENMDKILMRGEKLEDIDRKTDDLRAQSNDFQRHGAQLKCALMQSNAKMTLLIGAIVLFILAVLAVIIYLLVRKAGG